MKPSLNLHVLPTRIDCRQSYKDFYSHKDRLLGKGLEVLSHKPHILLKTIQYFLSKNKKKVQVKPCCSRKNHVF